MLILGDRRTHLSDSPEFSFSDYSLQLLANEVLSRHEDMLLGNQETYDRPGERRHRTADNHSPYPEGDTQPQFRMRPDTDNSQANAIHSEPTQSHTRCSDQGSQTTRTSNSVSRELECKGIIGSVSDFKVQSKNAKILINNYRS